MASQSFNLIDQEEEELVAFGTRQSRVPTPQSRPNSRMEMSQLIKSQEATAKTENRIVENVRALETKVSELVQSQSELIQSHTSTDDKLSHIAYKQIEQIAEMSDLVDRISPGQPIHWIGPNSEESNSSEACLDGQRALHSIFDHPLVTCHGEVENGQISPQFQDEGD